MRHRHGDRASGRAILAAMPVFRDEMRTPGVVYTPPDVAGPMVELALTPLVHGKSSRQLLALRVCDPAIGEGAFLVEAVRVLADHLERAWRAEGVERGRADAEREVAECIAGVDVDERAVHAARAKLGTLPLVTVADALALDWRAAYPTVFERGGFDAVIGNPPYIRQERLVEHKQALRTFASYDGAADLYVYFIELAHRILKPRGRYCLITPNKWLTAGYGRPLRTYLAQQRSVDGIVDISRGSAFHEDAFPSIVWGCVGENRMRPIHAARIGPAMTVAAALRDSGQPHVRERWQAGPWHIDLPIDRSLIDRMEQRWATLGSVLMRSAAARGEPERPSRGVVTGCNRAFVLDDAQRAKLLAAEPAAEPLVRPFVKGRDIRRWSIAAASRWLLLVDRGTSLDDLPHVSAHLEQFRAALEPRPAMWRGPWPGRKPGTYRWYELQDPVGTLAASRLPRLVYQDIQTGPACALVDGGIVPDTTVWILPSADLYLLAVLNSPIYGWYARRRFPPALNGAVRPKLEYMRELPIATPSESLRASIERLVRERLEIEPRDRDADPNARRLARDLDMAIEEAVLDAYELGREERTRVRAEV